MAYSSLKSKISEMKIMLRWIYDVDIEKLNELSQKQLFYEKELLKIDDNYKKALKSC